MKELFEKEAPRQVRRTRHQLLQLIDADYYGFRDEEDGLLVQLEKDAEVKLRAEVKLLASLECVHVQIAPSAACLLVSSA